MTQRFGNAELIDIEQNIFIVSAPSGAGKTSLVARLIAEVDNLSVCVSHTTRPRREGEVDGSNYHFTDEAAFRLLIQQNQFLEHANVFGNLYGTSVPAVQACTEAGNDVILEIDWQGADQARARLAGTVSVFILPPSREVLLDRLRGRGTDSENVIARRTAEAVEEMRHYDKADFLLVNDDFEQTLAEFKAVIVSQRAALSRRRVEHAALIDSLIETG